MSLFPKIWLRHVLLLFGLFGITANRFGLQNEEWKLADPDFGLFFAGVWRQDIRKIWQPSSHFTDQLTLSHCD